MITLPTLFLIAALICFILSAAGVASRIGLTPLGLAFTVAALLVDGVAL